MEPDSADISILKGLIDRPGGANVHELAHAVVRSPKYVTDLILNNRNSFGPELRAISFGGSHYRFFTQRS